MTDSMIPNDPSRSSARYHLWVDGVGGFLVCLAEEVSVGGLAPRDSADLALLADISRRHLAVRRTRGGYLLQPFGPVQVNGETVNDTWPLTSGDELTLGRNVRLRFAVPNPLSNTAVLQFKSVHRPVQALDGVLLMAETCLLGPASDHHVACPEWTSSLVLFRRDGELYCRTEPAVNSVPGDRATTVCLTSGGEVSGADYRISLEPVD